MWFGNVGDKLVLKVEEYIKDLFTRFMIVLTQYEVTACNAIYTLTICFPSL